MASLTVTPSPATRPGTADVVATGLPPGTRVNLRVDGSVIATGKAKRNGEFGSAVVIGATSRVGTHTAELRNSANTANLCPPVTFTVSDPVVVPPPPPSGISNVTVSTTPTSATIAWDVVPASPGQIRYGLTNQYGKLSTPEPSALSHHVQTLSGLVPGTLYHFAIVSGSNSPDSTLTTCWAP